MGVKAKNCRRKATEGKRGAGGKGKGGRPGAEQGQAGRRGPPHPGQAEEEEGGGGGGGGRGKETPGWVEGGRERAQAAAAPAAASAGLSPPYFKITFKSYPGHSVSLAVPYLHSPS